MPDSGSDHLSLRTIIAATALAAGASTGTASPAMSQPANAISASDRQQGARANPGLLAEYGGKYDAPQAAYAEQVGRRVAVQSGLSNAQSDFTVTLLNSPVENAFAIPGGYLYVTRQLLALMNSEAELGAVLGHEVGHVAARHSAGRQRTSTIGSLLAGVVGALAGNGAIGQLLGGAAQTGAQLYTLKYGRDQEYAADSLGVQYVMRAGYTPYALAGMLTSLNAETMLEARIAGRAANATPAWASTHPNGAERIARARAIAQQSGQSDTSAAQDTAFLRRLDGMLYDADPQQGVVDGQMFRHPALRFRFTAPAGYRIDNASGAVSVIGQGGQAQLKSAAMTSDLAGFLTTQFRALGAGTIAADAIRSGTANGVAFAYQTVRASANNQSVDASIVAYRFPANTLYFTILTSAGSGLGPFAPLVQSMAPLSASEAVPVKAKRIRIVTVKPGDTIDGLARQMAYPDFQRDRFVTLNGLAANAPLQPGMLVKVVTNG